MARLAQLALCALMSAGCGDEVIELGEAACGDEGVGSWTAISWVQRAGSSTIALADGRLLMLGADTFQAEDRTELYDPASESVEELPGTFGYFPAATQLSDGRVLVATIPVYNVPVASETRVLDLETRTWSDADPPPEWLESLTPLPDGDALAFSERGGVSRFEASDGTWTTLPAAPNDIRVDTTTALPDGSVIVEGQTGSQLPQKSPQTEAPQAMARLVLRFDPAGATWERVADRLGSGSFAVLEDGRVLSVRDREAILFDSDLAGFAFAAPPLDRRIDGHVAARLAGGALIAGGAYVRNPQHGEADKASRSAEIYDAASDTWICAAPMTEPRGFGWGALPLPDGRVLVTGGDNGATTIFAR